MYGMFVTIRKGVTAESLAVAVGFLFLLPCPASAGPPPGEIPISVALRVGGGDDGITYPGWPVEIRVRLANQKAMNAEFHNRAVEAYAEDILKQRSAGKMAPEEAAAKLARLATEEIRAVTFGVKHKAAAPPLVFEAAEVSARQGADSWKPIPWRTKSFSETPGKTVVLDGRNTHTERFYLEPDETKKMSPGQYEIRCHLNIPGAEGVSKSQRIRVLPLPAKSDPEHRLSRSLRFGRYHYAAGRLDESLAEALSAVETDDHSIPAMVLLAEVRLERKEYEEAIPIIEQALGEFYAQNPDPKEPPSYLHIMMDFARRNR